MTTATASLEAYHPMRSPDSRHSRQCQTDGQRSKSMTECSIQRLALSQRQYMKTPQWPRAHSPRSAALGRRNAFSPRRW